MNAEFQAPPGTKRLYNYNLSNIYKILNKITTLLTNFPLSKSEPIRYTPNHNLSFDLIRFQADRFKLAFYFVMKNTLVCENLDVATEVGFGRNRMRCVTLNGEVIETSGAMTGGGRPK